MTKYAFLLDDLSYAAVIPLCRHEKYQTTYPMVIYHQHNCIQSICDAGNEHSYPPQNFHYCQPLFGQNQRDLGQDLNRHELTL